MTWQALDLVVEQNADFTRSWYFYDDNAAGDYANMGDTSKLVPHDFTGCALKLQVRQTEQTTSTLIDTYGTATGEIVLSGSGAQNFPGANPPTAPAYNNGFTLSVLAARTSALTSGKYFFDLLLTTSGGGKDYIFSGRFEVVARQTR